MIDISLCPVCGNNTLTQDFSCIDYTVSRGSFQLVTCVNCSFRITSPRPTDNELQEYYQSDNYISHSRKAVSLVDKIYLIARKFTLRKKLNLISRLKKDQGTLLDYGCGTGEFLKTSKAAGWKIFGIEPSKTAREKASQLTDQKILSSIKEVDERGLDIITLWHVLEHIPDLNETLKNIAELLYDNGTIIIAVPNYTCFDAAHYENFWAGYDVPRHLWHFSPESMKKLLARNSLTITKIIPMKLDSFYVSLLSEKYKSNGKLGLGRMTKAFFVGLWSNIRGIKTGNYSSLIYIVKK